MGTLDNYKYWDYWNLFLHRGIYTASALYYDLVPNKTVVLNQTMPMLQENGMIRCAAAGTLGIKYGIQLGMPMC